MGPWQDEQYIEVAAPTDMVFRYLADFEAHPAWSEAVLSVETPAGGDYSVGAEFGLVGAGGKRRAARVTALQAPMRIAWAATSDDADEEWEFIVLPAKGATTLGLRLTVQPRKALSWLLRSRWRTADLAERNRTSLAMIKAILEASLADDGDEDAGG